jgi:hypothetical protein
LTERAKPMTLQELLNDINSHRGRAGLPRVELSTRPSSSVPGKTTIEVLTNGGSTMLAKSINGGAINWFLKGMLCGFGTAPAPKVNNFEAEIGSFRRAIDWR